MMRMNLSSAEGWSDYDDDGLDMIGDLGLAVDPGPMDETRHACDGGLIGYIRLRRLVGDARLIGDV